MYACKRRDRLGQLEFAMGVREFTGKFICTTIRKGFDRGCDLRLPMRGRLE